MARKNRNSFLKRQKEMERVRKAKEKMERRQGKKAKLEEMVSIAVPDGASQELEDNAGDDASEDNKLM